MFWRDKGTVLRSLILLHGMRARQVCGGRLVLLVTFIAYAQPTVAEQSNQVVSLDSAEGRNLVRLAVCVACYQAARV